MPGDMLLTFVILGVTILLFMSDRLRLDLVALMSLLALALTGIVTPAQALAGFSDPVVVMIAALFVVGGGIFRTGVADRFGRSLSKAAGTGRARLTLVVMLGAGLLSAFMSSTGTVAVMLPVTAAMAWNARISPSLLLIPLSVGAMLGGLLTLIGTAPNIVVANELAANGFAPFTLFDFTPIGLAALAIGTVVLVFFGGKLLPTRAAADGPGPAGAVASVEGNELIHGYGLEDIVRLRVLPESPLIGLSPAAAEVRKRYDVNVVANRRRRPAGGRHRLPSTGSQPIMAGDELHIEANPEALVRFREEQCLRLSKSHGGPEDVLAEVLLTPRSRLIGRTLAELRFRERYGVNVLSIKRQGSPLAESLATVPLRFADTMLVSGAPDKLDLLRSEAGDFVVVAEAAPPATPGRLSGRQISAIAVVVGMMGLLTFDIVPPVIAVILAAVGMVLTRCLDMEAAYRSINWESVVLIAAVLPMATALQNTGGMDLIVRQLGTLHDAGPLVMMAAIFVVTGVLSQVISNTATAVLIAPVALRAALELGSSPYPFLMAVAVAASSAMATPVASPINMLVLGPGAYRFGDFLKVGVIIQVLLLLLTLALVPLLFPF